MTRLIGQRIAFAAALTTLFVSACGAKTISVPGGGGGDASGDAGRDVGTDAGFDSSRPPVRDSGIRPDTAPPPPMMDAEPPPPPVMDAGLPILGRCDNNRDRRAINRDYGDTGDLSFEDLASDCGRGCIADADPETCTRICLQDQSLTSDGCAACYSEFVICGAQFCLAQCIADETSEECNRCLCSPTPAGTPSCTATRNACSGVLPRACPG